MSTPESGVHCQHCSVKRERCTTGSQFYKECPLSPNWEHHWIVNVPNDGYGPLELREIPHAL